MTHEHHLEALPASSGLGDLSAIPERGLPLPRWDRGFARLRWPAQSFAGPNPLSDSLTRPESSRRRRRGRAPRCPATASSARTSRPFRPYPRRPELDHAAGGLQLLLQRTLRQGRRLLVPQTYVRRPLLRRALPACLHNARARPLSPPRPARPTLAPRCMILLATGTEPCLFCRVC